MRPVSVVPQQVPVASVRRLHSGAVEIPRVQHVDVTRVPAPRVVPRQLDRTAQRLLALQLENDDLRAEVDQLRSG